MLTFFLVTLTTVSVFQFLTLPPAWANQNNRYTLVYRVLVVLLPFLILFLVGLAFFLWHHPQYGLRFYVFETLTEKTGFSILAGITLGITLGVLLNSITFSPPHRPLTTRNKILLVFLLVLLLLGIGGEQFLRDIGQRISKLSLGVAEIAFSDATQLRRGRPEGDPSLAGGLGDPMASAPAISLDIFLVLPELIDRDRINIKAAYDRKKLPPPEPVLTALVEADKLAQTLIAPVGDCVKEIYRQTGDLDFVRKSLSLLLPPLRDLGDLSAPKHRDPKRFGEDGALAFVRLWGDLFIFAFDRGDALQGLAPGTLESKCRLFSLSVLLSGRLESQTALH